MVQLASLASSQNALAATPVSMLVSTLDQPSVLAVRSDNSVAQAIELLASNHILSAPVIDAAGRGTVGEYSGCISVVDILKALMTLLADRYGQHWVDSVALMTESELQEIGHALFQLPVSGVMHSGSLWVNTDLDKTNFLKFVAHGFNTLSTHPSHRVYLCGPANPGVKSSPWTVTSVISQLDVLRFIRNQLPEALASASLHSVGLDIGAAFTVSHDTVTLSAFEQMWADHHSCVGVRDASGELVANLSASDLRFIGGEHGFSKLLLPVSEFVTLLKGSENSIIAITPESTLGETLDEMVSCGIHRVYIVDRKEDFCGIVTATDLIKLFANTTL